MSDVQPKIRGKIAAMVRVSTDKQETDSQRSTIQRWADGQGLMISQWYEEVGRSRHKAISSDPFEGMITDGEARVYDWLVVESRTRLGTKDGDEYGFYATRLKRAGVGIYSIAQGDLTNPTDTVEITNSVEGITSKSELKEKARRTARGMFDNGLAGLWNGGAVPPYGYDLSCVDPSGREHFRVVILAKHHRVVVNPSGDRLELIGAGRNPGKAAKSDRYRLVVSEVAERVEAVRAVFAQYDRESISLSAIAKDLNSRGILLYGRPWTNGSVRNLLENPIYVGRKSFNKRTGAAYQRIPANGQGYIEAEWENNKPKYQKLPKDQWVAPTATDEAGRIIDDELFERVQAKLAGITTPNRAPRSAALWLTPFLTCGSCNGKMRGWAPATNRAHRSYFCATFDIDQKAGQPPRCRKNRVLADTVEAALTEFLQRYGEACHVEAEASRDLLKGRPNPRLETLRREQASGVASVGAVFVRMRQVVQEAAPESLPDPEGPDYFPRLLDAYTRCHETGQSGIRSELVAAEDHLGRLVGQVAYLEPGGPAHRALLRQIGETETKIRDLEARLVPLAQRLDETIARFGRLEDDIRSLQKLMDGSANRMKAEALSKIIRRIVIHTKVNPKQGGWHPSDLLESVTFEPIQGEPVTIAVP